jgi:hypothetical protein
VNPTLLQVRDVAQVGSLGRTVAYPDIAIRTLPAAHAVKEVLDVIDRLVSL